jgi:histone H3/H4
MLKNYADDCKKHLNFDQESEIKVLKEIKQYKKVHKLVFSKTCFQALVQEISDEVVGEGYLWKSSSSEALQQIAEDYIIGLLEDSNYCAAHANRVTLLVKDLQLARRIRGRFESFIETSRLN